MSTRTKVHPPLVSDLPDDFGERIEEFRVASGLGVRSLARLLGVSPHRVREWRRGIAPSSEHLFALVTVADAMGLKGVLVRPDQDLPTGFGLHAPPSGVERTSLRGCKTVLCCQLSWCQGKRGGRGHLAYEPAYLALEEQTLRNVEHSHAAGEVGSHAPTR